MSKLQKVIAGAVSVLAILILAMLLTGTTKEQVGGGLINNLPVDFPQGIKVDGVQVLTGAGVFTGPVTSTGAVTGLRAVVAPAGDATLTTAQSGSIVKMNTAGQDVTLPTASTSVGAHYRFVVTAAVATTNMTIVADPADTIEGTLIVAGAVVDCDATDIITFVIDGENIGDFVDLYTDGTSWLIGESGTLTASKMTCSG